MTSSYRATVLKEDNGLWVFRVYENWGTRRQALIARGSDTDWRTVFCQAAGTVSAYRSIYEYKYEDGR